MNNFPKLLNSFERCSQILSQKQQLNQKPLQQVQQQSLAKSFSSGLTRPLKQANDRLAESCRGKIDMGSNDESDLTDLNWLSSLTPQVLTNPLDVDNVGAEEMLESSMNSTSSTTEQSDTSQSVSQSTDANSSLNMSHLGQRYHQFLQERRRTEGESRRITQGNPVLLNQASMMYESNNQPQPQYTKPPLSFGALICLAIESSERRRLPVKDIYLWIESHFPYYKNASGMSWKNSVRHNLSLSKAFVKIPRDVPGGKGCLWGINDEYRNSLISSFRRSGLSYPLVLPVDTSVQIAANHANAGPVAAAAAGQLAAAVAERSLPEYYSQAALQQQQHPLQLSAAALAALTPANAQLAEQLALDQRSFVLQCSRPSGSDDHNTTFLRNLKFFNQAIKRTRSWMFKEQIEEEEEEEETQNKPPVPLESHGLTPEQITELNRLSRRARRRKTRIFRHITPAPSLEHDYCKNELGPEDLYESETEDEAVANASEANPSSPKRSRPALGLGASPTRRRHDRLMRKLTPHGSHRPALWAHNAYRRNAYSGRISSAQLNGSRVHGQNGVPRPSAGASGPNPLVRRRRPGRPPKVRTASQEANENRNASRRKRARSTRKRAPARMQQALDRSVTFDDADTEPMIDDSDEEEMRRLLEEEEEDLERSDSLPIEDDHKAAELLLALCQRPQQVMPDRDSGEFSRANGVHPQAPAANSPACAQAPPISDDDASLGDSGRANMSPENVPPPTSPNSAPPKRRGRRPRKELKMKRGRGNPLFGHAC